MIDIQFNPNFYKLEHVEKLKNYALSNGFSVSVGFEGGQVIIIRAIRDTYHHYCWLPYDEELGDFGLVMERAVNTLCNFYGVTPVQLLIDVGILALDELINMVKDKAGVTE